MPSNFRPIIPTIPEYISYQDFSVSTNKVVGWVFAILACLTVQVYVSFGEGTDRATSIKKWDAKTGKKVFTQAQKSKPIKTVATLFSLLGDEIIWFGIPTVFGTLISFTRLARWFVGFCTAGSLSHSLLVPVPEMGCIEESLWDMFGFSATCILVETTLKNIFRRKRPSYAKQQQEGFAVPGEWYSFPSGHALRSFYIPFWFSRNTLMTILTGKFFRARYLLPLSFGVGWSRIAKGRHYPFDVVFGSLLGILMGFVIEELFSDAHRAIVKTISGIFLGFAFGLQYLMLYVKVTPGKLTLFFFYFSMLFLFTLPVGQWEVFGLQTIDKDECRRYF